jgi:hypothetical protein
MERRFQKENPARQGAPKQITTTSYRGRGAISQRCDHILLKMSNPNKKCKKILSYSILSCGCS